MSKARQITATELWHCRAGVDRSWQKMMASYSSRAYGNGGVLYKISDRASDISSSHRVNSPRHLGAITKRETDGIAAAEKLCDAACSAGATDTERLFFRIFVGRSSLESEDYLQARSRAEQNHDAKFFRGFASLLDLMPLAPFEHPAMTALPRLLLRKWDSPGAGHLALFSFGRGELTRTCKIILRLHGTVFMVEKCRDRLGLPTLKRIRADLKSRLHFVPQLQPEV